MSAREQARELAHILLADEQAQSRFFAFFQRLFAPLAYVDRNMHDDGGFGSKLDGLTPTNSSAEPQQILSIGTSNGYAQIPQLFAVTLAWARPQTPPSSVIDWTGSLQPYARLEWVTGRGKARAEVDIPAGGTVFTLGGADGLTIHVGVRGTTTTPISIQALVNIAGGAASRPAQRTLTFVLPAQVGAAGRRLVPSFARQVRTEMTDPRELPLVFLDYFDEPIGGALIQRSGIDASGITPIPVGAAGVEISGGSGAANTVNTIWELWI
jgi:hypothetical protein